MTDGRNQGVKRPSLVLPKWMVSSSHVRRVRVQGEDHWMPYAAHHARMMGAIATVCGINAQFFTNFYERAFQADAFGACDECSAALREMGELGS